MALLSFAAAASLRTGMASAQQSSEGKPGAGAGMSTLVDEDLLHDAASPILGNPQGDVTMVEFFDYRCPYCKMMAPRVAALVAGDHGLRLVMKEYPVLSRESIVAAKVALVVLVGASIISVSG